MADLAKTIELDQAQATALSGLKKRLEDRATSGSSSWATQGTFKAIRVTAPYERTFGEGEEKVTKTYVRVRILGAPDLPPQSVRVPDLGFSDNLMEVSLSHNAEEDRDFWQLGMSWQSADDVQKYAGIIQKAGEAFASLDVALGGEL